MSKSAKVAISVPEDILKAVETERKAKGESRSQFFRRAVEGLLKEERGTSAIQDYIRGYREIPESAEEVAAAHQVGSAVVAEELWE
jgi:metal-responsive CopG/Arc/MetJ family transcriptional regulator